MGNYHVPAQDGMIWAFLDADEATAVVPRRGNIRSFHFTGGRGNCIVDIQGLSWENGKENGNYYLGAPKPTSHLEIQYELQSKLLKGGYKRDDIGDYYSGYSGVY